MDTGGMEVRSHSPGSLNEENRGFLLIVRRYNLRLMLREGARAKCMRKTVYNGQLRGTLAKCM